MTWKPLLLASLLSAAACPAQVAVTPDPAPDAPNAVRYTWRNDASKPVWPQIALRQGGTETASWLASLPPHSRGTMRLTLRRLHPVSYLLVIQFENGPSPRPMMAAVDVGDVEAAPQTDILSNAVPRETRVDPKRGLILCTVDAPPFGGNDTPCFRLTLSDLDPETLPGSMFNTEATR